MAGLFKPPKELDFAGNISQKWRTFSNEFEIFLCAAGLEDKADKRKTMTLLNVIGARGRAVYETFTFEDAADRHKLQTVLTKFETHCIPKQNELLERQRYYARHQGKTENITQYVSALRKLAQYCNFGQAEDSVIRDQVVKGMVPDEKLQTKLFEEEELTLERLVQIISAHEVRVKMTTTETTTGAAAVDGIRYHKGRQYANARPRTRAHADRRDPHKDKDKAKSSQAGGTPAGGPCDRCGYEKHFGPKCPALGRTCTKCQRPNHFASKCRTKTVKVNEVECDEEYFYVDTVVDRIETCKDDWKVKVMISDCVQQDFKIDTGADVNTLPKSVYDKLDGKCELKHTNAKLEGYFGKVERPLGMATLQIEYKSKYYPVDFMIIQSNKTPILGRRTCVEMGIVQRIYDIESNCTTQHIVDSYAQVFTGLGCIKTAEYDITMKPDVKPVVNPPRRVPYALRDRLKEALDKLVEDDVITQVTEPTEWVNSLVVVEKPNGKLRLCLDPTELNKGIQREHYPMKTIEEVAANLDGAVVFSVLDASQAFYQIRVSEKSSKLLAFNTPFGRYMYRRLPFGISSAPEVWERTACEIFEGIKGVEIIRDEVLVKGKTLEEHNEVLQKTLARAEEYGLKFNLDKCEFAVNEVKHQGHVFCAQGVKVDPEKVTAITEFPTPQNVDDVRRFLGIVNYVGKFVPNLSQKAEPLRILLNNKVEWHWEQAQENAMKELKNSVSEAPVLKYYNLDEPVTVSVDASTKGVGAVLFQGGRPVHYASRGLTPAEKNYGQIEKEMLAIKYGCEKFHDYIYGRNDVTVETDHKPLEFLYRKSLVTAPPRIQRMMLKLLKYTFKVVWIEGKSMIVPDALSRSPIHESVTTEEEYEVLTVRNLPISDVRLSELKDETQKDMHMQTLKQYVCTTWPEFKNDVPDELKPYWNVRDELYVSEGVLLKNERLVVPSSMRSQMLKQIHRAHMGAEKCIGRAKDVFYWPGMSSQITDMCIQCSVCAEFKSKQQKEPMVLTQLPERPWQKVGSDLFEFDGKTYVLLADYYTKYVEFTELEHGSDSKSVIDFFKDQFARHGIAEQVITDGGPQYSSKLFSEFAESYGFQHIKSSPEYPQSNGFAESQVKVLKSIMKKAKSSNTELCLALLEWRNTPIKGLGSPAQLALGRRTRSTIPMTTNQLRPKPVTVKLTDVLAEKQLQQKQQYDKHTRSDRQALKLGEEVRMRTSHGWASAKVVQPRVEPRSYDVQRGTKVYRRNRRDILQVPQRTVASETKPVKGHMPSVSNKSQVHVPKVTNTKVTKVPVSQETVKPTVRVPQTVTVTPTVPKCGNINKQTANTQSRVSRVSGREIKVPHRYR